MRLSFLAQTQLFTTLGSFLFYKLTLSQATILFRNYKAFTTIFDN